MNNMMAGLYVFPPLPPLHSWISNGLCSFMVFNATVNNISVISWRSVLLVEDPEKTTDLLQVIDKLLILYTRKINRV